MRIKKIGFLVILFSIVHLGCSSNESEIPSRIKNLENLLVFSADIGPKSFIRFNRDIAYGEVDNVLIGQISEIAVDLHSNLFIADGTTNRIHGFESNGKFMGTIGGEGDGPGEFRNIQKMEFMENTLYVYDVALQRINMFKKESVSSPMLDFTELISLSLNNLSSEIKDTESFFPIRFMLRNDNTFVLGASDPINSVGLDKRKIHFFLFDENGEIIPQKLFEQQATEFLNIEPTIFLFPFLRTSVAAISNSNTIYSIWTENFLVKTYDSTGNYSEAFYYPVERKELTLDHVLEIYQGTDENSYVKNEREKVLRNINLPQYWPAVENLLVDDENRLWISTIVEDFDIYEWWVLEERGELITKFEWTRDEPIEVVKNGFMYTRQTDEETGLQQVVRYRIEMELI